MTMIIRFQELEGFPGLSGVQRRRVVDLGRDFQPLLQQRDRDVLQENAFELKNSSQ